MLASSSATSTKGLSPVCSFICLADDDDALLVEEEEDPPPPDKSVVTLAANDAVGAVALLCRLAYIGPYPP